MRRARRSVLVASLCIAALGTGACTTVRSHQGYVIDADLVNSVQPGVDNRESVTKTLGNPSFASQFGAGDWYYVSRDSRNFAFRNPRPRDQVTLRISFDARGTVTAVRRSGVEQVTAVHPYGKVTPTLGRQRGFFQDLFGNIGTVGAAGMGGAPSGGAGSDTP